MICVWEKGLRLSISVCYTGAMASPNATDTLIWLIVHTRKRVANEEFYQDSEILFVSTFFKQKVTFFFAGVGLLMAFDNGNGGRG